MNENELHRKNLGVETSRYWIQ